MFCTCVRANKTKSFQWADLDSAVWLEIKVKSSSVKTLEGPPAQALPILPLFLNSENSLLNCWSISNSISQNAIHLTMFPVPNLAEPNWPYINMYLHQNAQIKKIKTCVSACFIFWHRSVTLSFWPKIFYRDSVFQKVDFDCLWRSRFLGRGSLKKFQP